MFEKSLLFEGWGWTVVEILSLLSLWQERSECRNLEVYKLSRYVFRINGDIPDESHREFEVISQIPCLSFPPVTKAQDDRVKASVSNTKAH